MRQRCKRACGPWVVRTIMKARSRHRSPDAGGRERNGAPATAGAPVTRLRDEAQRLRQRPDDRDFKQWPRRIGIDHYRAAADEERRDLPLRDQPTVVNTVPGAMPIQRTLDRFQWVQQAGNPVSYAAHIRKDPLPGNTAKPVLVQFAKGDQTVPNPTSSALIRAGDLLDRTVYYRHDLAFAAFPLISSAANTWTCAS